ncbi:MAG: bifunctional riboflavin kinase/FAD synthetase [Amaricoccus sp.]|uniref:bifunctional riboflavin kinase/FAD synthetase n=1 Tax=Amaricoccus sp. TaxID=1872485 RepID=UPI0039E45527
MKLIRDYRGLAAADRGAAVAMGNFDGVHLGHQSVLALAHAASAELGVPFGVVTFEPHPRAFFAPGAPPFRLTTAEARASRMAKLGVEVLYELPFTPDLAGLEPRAFVRDVLVEGLGVRFVAVGADFRFGRARSGDTEALKTLADGFGVAVAPLVSDHAGDYSSTAIRAALAAGEPRRAARILGHWHRVQGRVEHGKKLGRELGFPTINLSLDGLHLPRFGVYAVTVDVLSGPHRGRYPGAASFGVRPTVSGDGTPNLEVYLIGFSGDLYDEEVSVGLVDFLRPEVRYDTLEALVGQIGRDVEDARARLAEAGAM